MFKIQKTHYLLYVVLLLFYSCKEEKLSKYQTTQQQVQTLISKDRYESLERLDSAIYNTSFQDKLYLGILYFEKGNIYYPRGNYLKAIENFDKATHFFQNTKNELYLLRSHFGLGVSYSLSGNKVLATEHLLKSLELSKKLKNKQREAKAYSMLAHTFLQYKNYQKAVDYTQQAIAIYQVEKDTRGLSETYNNLAVIYKNKGNLLEALSYNLKSLELNRLLNDNNGIAKSYNNLGQVYFLLNDENKAMDYYKKAAELNKKTKNDNPTPLINIGNHYAEINDTKKAITYFQKALIMNSKTGNFQMQKDIANKLLNLSLQNKEYENSLKYQKIRDSLQLLQTKLENDEKLKLSESQYNLATKKTELKQIKAINTKNRIIFISVLIGLIILGLLFWQRLKNKQLQLEQEKLNLERTVLRSQMNPHFIFNALSAIQNSLFDNTPMKSASYLSRFAKLIRQNFDFISQKEISLADEIDALKNYMETQKIRFLDKFDYQILVDESVNINIVKIPPLLLQPLAENTIEHGFKNKKDKGIILLKIMATDTEIQYEISDNGKGFVSDDKKDNKQHALDIFKKRLALLNPKNQETLFITSNKKGTSIKFSLLK